MKINPITRGMVARKVNNTGQINFDTDINVKRVPSRKEKLETFINLYGEKELKHYGLIACKTCVKRVYKDGANKIHKRIVGQVNNLPVSICPECGRSYDDKGLIKVSLKDDKYNLSLELFEGLRFDEKL